MHRKKGSNSAQREGTPERKNERGDDRKQEQQRFKQEDKKGQHFERTKGTNINRERNADRQNAFPLLLPASRKALSRTSYCDDGWRIVFLISLDGLF